jgi:hypothetical protein
MLAENVLNGDMHVADWLALDRTDALLLDVRQPIMRRESTNDGEYSAGHRVISGGSPSRRPIAGKSPARRGEGAGA